MNPKINEEPTPAQIEAARRNGMRGGAVRRDLSEFPCLCVGPHRRAYQRCPRGLREYQREYYARPDQVKRRQSRHRNQYLFRTK